MKTKIKPNVTHATTHTIRPQLRAQQYVSPQDAWMFGVVEPGQLVFADETSNEIVGFVSAVGHDLTVEFTLFVPRDLPPNVSVLQSKEQLTPKELQTALLVAEAHRPGWLRRTFSLPAPIHVAVASNTPV